MLPRVLTVLITVIATYWYGRTRTWEAFFTAVGFLLAYFSTETYSRFRSEKRVAADRELFTKLQSELPFDGSIRFLRDHHLRLAFKWSELNDLLRFIHTWTDESRKFHDKRLERAKESLTVTVHGFLHDLSTNTFPQIHGDLQEIPNEWMRDQQERYKEVSVRLNNGANEVVKAHQRLVELARKRLEV